MTSIAQATVQQQLQMLKEQTRLTGGLHEAQVLQLKMWPMVVFDTATATKFTWDPDKRIVAFSVDFSPKSKPRKLDWWKPRVNTLNAWVQVLLGDDWMIEVRSSHKDAKTFRGSRKVSDVGSSNRPQPGR